MRIFGKKIARGQKDRRARITSVKGTRDREDGGIWRLRREPEDDWKDGKSAYSATQGTRKSLPVYGQRTFVPGAMPWTSTIWFFFAKGL